MKRYFLVNFVVAIVFFTIGYSICSSSGGKRDNIIKKERIYRMKNSEINFFESQTEKEIVYAGIRRSVYGLKEKNSDDAWWANRAIEYSKLLSKLYNGEKTVIPVIIEIVSGYYGNGGSIMDFKKPDDYTVKSQNLLFNQNRGIDHERALSLYDSVGVKTILQLESGNCDVIESLELINKVLGKHSSIIGYGIDAEWYFYEESLDKTGMPISDEQAAKWLDKILSFNSSYTLFLKHWEVTHMPKKFKNPNLWYLSDSQEFGTLNEMMQDFTLWSSGFNASITGYQFGYQSDMKWWSKLKNPLWDISRIILKDLDNAKFVFWVDFTADKINFNTGEIGDTTTLSD